jgi:hypothetical protein
MLLKQRPLMLGIKRPAEEREISLSLRGPLGLELRWLPSDKFPVVVGVSAEGEARAVGLCVEDRLRLVNERRADKDFVNKQELVRTLQRQRPLGLKVIRWTNM